MNKKELITAVATMGETTKKEAERFIDLVFACIDNALENGDKVKVPGHGTYEVKDRAERKGHNPQTKEEMIIPAKKVPTFKPAKDLKERVDK